MRTPSTAGLLLTYLAASIALISAEKCQPWLIDKKQRVFVLSDIANEPDDTMSFVRLLAHSDLYQIEGMVAITSFWLPNATHPEQIRGLVDTYGLVRDNLQTHSNLPFPEVDYLKSKIASGPDSYGMQALKALEAGGNLTSGAELLISAVGASAEPLYIQIWGGSNTLATALWYVNRTRPSDLGDFSSKIRAYSISDQDDTGIWIRRNFPAMQYIASRHGFNQYPVATWTGISSSSVDVGGPDTEIVSQEWLAANIQIGPLGKQYPDVLYIMEGDSPTLLYNIPNGLGDPEHPSWGSWGGRYTPDPLDGNAQYGDAVDVVQGLNGQTFTSNKATIWRWRDAFQQEFAARMQWTLGPNGPESNTTHPPVVVVNDSCGSQALELNVTVGQNLTLDASASYTPDANANLNFTWLHYREPSSYQSSPAVVPSLNLTYPDGIGGPKAAFTIPKPISMDGNCVLPQDVTQFGAYGEMQKCPVLHVVVAVKALDVSHPITRYRRILLHVQPYMVDT